MDIEEESEFDVATIDVDKLVIVEAMDRINYIVGLVNNKEEIESINLEFLEIDKESLEFLEEDTKYGIIVSNLLKKIDYILDSFEIVEDEEN